MLRLALAVLVAGALSLPAQAADSDDPIATLRVRERQLETEIIEAQTIANHLNAYRREREQIRQQMVQKFGTDKLELAAVQRQVDFTFGMPLAWAVSEDGAQATASLHLPEAPGACMARLDELVRRARWIVLRDVMLNEHSCDLSLAVTLGGTLSETHPRKVARSSDDDVECPVFSDACPQLKLKLAKYRSELSMLQKIVAEATLMKREKDVLTQLLANAASAGIVGEAVPVIAAFLGKAKPLAAASFHFDGKQVELLWRLAPGRSGTEVLSVAKRFGSVTPSELSADTLTIERAAE